jgi:uncharacterized protein YodC (DUF2158 family)
MALHIEDTTLTEDTAIIGAVVQLKSGGPTMTIVSTSNNPKTFTCMWFDSRNTSDFKRFQFENSTVGAFYLMKPEDAFTDTEQ